ncbi:helix-turn-helix transcriptional regulator [Myxococcota bacterium]|nr:helix-turn-helix transcriptional regulator [Myxococcota bacterium]
MRRRELVGLIDAATERSAADLDTLLATARRLFPVRGSWLGWSFSLSAGELEIDEVVEDEPIRGLTAHISQANAPRPDRIFGEAQAGLGAHVIGRALGLAGPAPHLPQVSEMYDQFGWLDTFGLVATGTSGRGLFVSVGIPTTEASAHDWGALARDWSLLARHLSHVRSVEGALELGADWAEFDLRGRGEFNGELQRSDVRRELGERARQIEHVRDESDTEWSAATAWLAIASGRYSIVRQRLEGGQARYLAVENPPELRAVRALSRREREVVSRIARGLSNKAIAIELEIHDSAISATIKTALRKLGLSDRTQLARLVRALDR